MPLNAKFWEADALPLRVRSVVEEIAYSAPSGSPQVSHFVQGVTRETPDTITIADRILLRASSSQAGIGSWIYSYYGPGAPPTGYHVSGAGFKATLDLMARIRGIKPYVNGPGNILSHKWRQTWTAVEIWIEGALHATLPGSAVDETSLAFGPCYLPLLGIPLEVTGGIGAADPQGISGLGEPL